MEAAEEIKKQRRAKKMMLWFSLISLVMGFAGWTSAYIVSSKRKDWIAEIDLPFSFWISTAVILVSSVTFYIARRRLRQENYKSAIGLLGLTALLGIVFVYLQFAGFSAMIANGYYFTGPTSSIKISYIFLIAFVHLIHLFAGLIVLAVVSYKTLKQRYVPSNSLGFELGETFWHFLGLLWLYLVLFMHFVK
ncbi:MAG: cytochrome c oxidase subunit 3 [Flavobacteriaceae bacterium]|jgi:cytochrome c oxidase subunit 3